MDEALAFVKKVRQFLTGYKVYPSDIEMLTKNNNVLKGMLAELVQVEEKLIEKYNSTNSRIKKTKEDTYEKSQRIRQIRSYLKRINKAYEKELINQKNSQSKERMATIERFLNDK